MICISRRSGRISRRLNFVMSWPSKTIRPAVGSISFVMRRAVVDFPQPDSPTSPSVSPLRMSKVTSSTRSEEHTSELQSHSDLVCRLLLEKKKTQVYPAFLYKKKKKNQK